MLCTHSNCLQATEDLDSLANDYISDMLRCSQSDCLPEQQSTPPHCRRQPRIRKSLLAVP